jgi:Protein of unknown function (DUF2867)
MEEGSRMKLPNTVHTSRPWRIHELTRDFRLEDVWALPTPGGPGDFGRLVQLIASGDASRGSKDLARVLWVIRRKLGELLGWDGSPAGPPQSSLRDRLPANLRDGPVGPDARAPFTSLYLTGDEWAAEIINRTVHGVLHLGWVPDQADRDHGQRDHGQRYHGQLAVYVKPNGLLGQGYMAAITPFRYLIVYPSMIKQIGRAWREHGDDPALARA